MTTTTLTEPAHDERATRVARAAWVNRWLRGWVRPAVSLVGGLAVWEIVGRYLVTDRTFFVPFSDAAVRMVELFASGDLVNDIRVSAIELVVGYLCAVLVGTAIGTAMGLSSRIRSMLIFWVDVFNATPVLALAPLFILMLGIGLTSKFAFVTFVAVWTILLNTMQGFLHTDQPSLEMARSFGCSKWQEFKWVRLPYAIPTIAVGLRVGVGRAVAGVVVGELFGSTAGLGYRLFASRDAFDTAGIFAAIILFAVLALIAVNIMGIFERRLSSWRQ